MDGAWALYEAWVRLQHGDVDSALVYAFGKSSLGDLPTCSASSSTRTTWRRSGPTRSASAALQARAWLDAGHDEGEMAEVAARSRKSAQDNPNAGRQRRRQRRALLRRAVRRRRRCARHDCPPISDGAAAVVLAAGDLAREVCERPAWITRDRPPHRGSRPRRARPDHVGLDQAGRGAGGRRTASTSPSCTRRSSHQEPILRDALGLSDGVDVNPSGGALTANVVMAAGLTRIGEAAQRIMDGQARAGRVAHATSGPCLQQNLVCVLSRRRRHERARARSSASARPSHKSARPDVSIAGPVPRGRRLAPSTTPR